MSLSPIGAGAQHRCNTLIWPICGYNIMLLKINAKNNCHIIKRMRESANLKQNELGLATGYSPSTICKIEKGKKIPTIIDLHNFANATNCQISITFKIPVYSKYRKDVIDYEGVSW